MVCTSEPLRTKDAAMKSTSFSTPQSTMSTRSLSVMVGRSTITPGRLQFFRSPSVLLLRQVQPTLAAASSHSSTRSTMEPSAMRMLQPGDTSRARLG